VADGVTVTVNFVTEEDKMPDIDTYGVPRRDSGKY